MQTLSLINTTPLNLDTFRLIEKVFPNLITVELQGEDIHPLAEDDDDDDDDDGEEKSIGVLSMNEDLLLDTGLQLPSVTKFRIRIRNQRVDYNTFHRFLRLFPNLVDLELDTNDSLLQDLLEHRNDDDLIQTLSNRVNRLHVVSWYETDTLTEVDIRDLFPRIKTS